MVSVLRRWFTFQLNILSGEIYSTYIHYNALIDRLHYACITAVLLCTKVWLVNWLAFRLKMKSIFCYKKQNKVKLLFE